MERRFILNKNLDVICVGAAIVDIPLQPVSKDIFNIESYPIEEIKMTVGGDALNEATIISRLGFKTGLIALIGKDASGNFILEHCKKDNIDISGVKILETVDTSINIGLVTSDGERTFITNRNGSLWKTNIEHIDIEKIKTAKILSLASIFNNPLLNGKALTKLFQEAKKENMIICADMIKPRLGESLEDIKEALSYVDYFFPNYDEAKILTDKISYEDIAKSILKCGVKNIIIKIGSKGCFIANNSETMIVPAVKNIKPIDTIGAGDNFVSGFIAGILQNKSLSECGIYGNCTAAISVQYIGATTGVTKLSQVDEILKKYINDYK